MGEKDIITKGYMSDPEVFADAFNYLLYGGRQVIKPEQLHKKDSAVMATPYGKGESSREIAKGSSKGTDSIKAVQRYRDNLKSFTMMGDDDADYLILGIEGQTEQHFAMPVRNMLYDAMQYAEQVNETARTHRRGRKQKESFGTVPCKKSVNRGEFLSGFYKDDKLTPVITLVILFGTDPWEGPIHLHEMFSVKNEGILQYVPDYPIHLMVPASMSDDEINLLSSSLREVIMFLKYAADDERMAELMRQNDRFRTLDRQAANVLNVLMNCGLEIDEEEERVDMCIAWDNMRKNAERLGLEKGERLGLEKGARNLMTSMGWTMEQAMNALQIPKDEQMYYAEKLKS